MSEATFDQLDETCRTQGAAATIDRLITTLREEKRYHALFDALLMRKRLDMGLPLTRPTSLKDVPEARRNEFEQFYIDRAREVGTALIGEGSLGQAWNYFRAINEPQLMAQAIEALPEDAQAPEEIIEIALFHGVAPVKGLKLFLASHGTCSTITAFDQQYLQLPAEFRKACSSVLVQKLYDDLRSNVEHDVKRRQPMTPPGLSLRELIAGREALFADDAYHIDVSHLNAVVRFGRALEADCPELDLALQLAQYGARLSPQYQYAGNAPFDDFYPAHIHFYQALLGQNREEALAYFRNKLGDDTGDTDNQLTAYVLTDLLLRLGRKDEAVELASKYLAEAGEEFGLSLPDLCTETGRFDLLKSVSRDKDDLIHYTAALIGNAAHT